MNVFVFVLSFVLPVLVTGLFLLLTHKVKAFRELKWWQCQISSGLVLGLCSVAALFMALGPRIVPLNVVDAPIFISSLAMGPLSGIITGALALSARLINDFADSGAIELVEIPAILTTATIALAMPLIKRFLFRKQTVGWYYGIVMGIAFEALFAFYIYLFYFDKQGAAYNIVSTTGWQMLLSVSLTVGAGLLVWSLPDWRAASKKKETKGLGPFKLKNALGLGLFGTLLVSLTLALGFAFVGQGQTAYSQMKIELTMSIRDASYRVRELSDRRFGDSAIVVSAALQDNPDEDRNEILSGEVAPLGITVANFVGIDGVVAYSSDPLEIGRDLRTDYGTFVPNFLTLLEAKTEDGSDAEMVLNYDDELGMKYAARAYFEDGSVTGIVMIGAETSAYYNLMSSSITMAAHNHHVGNNGFLFIVSPSTNYVISSSLVEIEGKAFHKIGFVIIQEGVGVLAPSIATYDGEEYYFLTVAYDTYSIWCAYPVSEMNYQRDSAFFMIASLLLVVVGIIFLFVFALLDWQVIGKLDRLGDKLESIAQGNLDEKVGRLGNEEFDRLGASADKTVGVLRGYIAREASRFDRDLAVARDLQFGSLPSVDHLLEYHDFKIGALMRPAREVGGDFYDFFLLPDGRLAFLIADVSDKGIPAAMFMMRAKAVIHSLCQMKLPPNEVFAQTNRLLVEKNDLNMFITAWLGFLDRETGEVEYVNAGHNPPLLRKKWAYEYLNDDPSPVLGAFRNSVYALRKLKLRPLDGLFLYTDGVTEATDISFNLFGEGRLRSFLDSYGDFEPGKMCDKVLEKVDAFLASADQNDDITMLSLAYMGPYVSKTFDYPATVESFAKFQGDLDQMMEEAKLDADTRSNIHICAEEYFVNVASYAYPKKAGDIRVSVAYTPYEWNLSFLDSGLRFNPLLREDPDVDATFNERPEGGLGIYMVKQIADSVYYSYLNRQNVNVFSIHTARAKKGK